MELISFSGSGARQFMVWTFLGTHSRFSCYHAIQVTAQSGCQSAVITVGRGEHPRYGDVVLGCLVTNLDSSRWLDVSGILGLFCLWIVVRRIGFSQRKP